MSAARLREAAALMRERAEAANATEVWDWRSTSGSTYWAQETRTGRYIQAMSPAVALAVADWLEVIASGAEPGGIHSSRRADVLAALAVAVADAYLGSAS